MGVQAKKPILRTEIILGKDLSEEIIQLMNNQRIKEYGENTKDFRNNEKDSTFFFLKDGNYIQAFGMLKPVTLYYEDQQYPIMGIANVISLEKSKGLGTIIMKHITNYLDENKLAGMGNTYTGNFDFYRKCGYTFIPGLLPRMVYLKDNGEELRTETKTETGEDYAMFIYDPHESLRDIIGGDKPVIIKVPFW